METIIGTLSELSGHTYDMVYELIFTSERIVAVIIQHPEDTRSYQSAYSLGSIMLGSLAFKRKEQQEQYRISDERRESITKLTPEELLKSSEYNFEIKYDQVTSVQISRGLIETKLKFMIQNDKLGMLQRIFTMPKKQIPEARNLLEQVLKSKIKD